MSATFTSAVVREGLAFGEAPRWHEGRLWYSDFYRHGVYSMAEDGSDERLELSVPGQPSGLGWMPDGSLLVVSMTDHRLLRWAPGTEPTVHADLTEHCGFWLNDMVVASDGTAYVGNFGFDLDGWLDEHGAASLYEPPGPPTTNLIVVSASGEVLQTVPEMNFPNGSVLSPDGQLLIVAETLAMKLTAFDVANDGTLSNRRLFAQLEFVAADGICLDANGDVWVANAIGPQAVRVSEGGVVTGTVNTVMTCFACMLGGDDGRSLYLMTGPNSHRDKVADQFSGRIECVTVDTPHAGRP